MTVKWLLSFLLSVAWYTSVCPVAASKVDGNPELTQPVRLWLDEVYFSPSETFFTRVEAAKSQGRLAIVSGAGGDGLLSARGADVPDAWDIYFTNRRQCYMAMPKVHWPQRINCLPGTESFTLKKSLVHTMQVIYGHQAAELMPRSFLLPEQYLLWRWWVESTKPDVSQTWVLKTNMHRGKGVHLHPLSQGLQQVQQSLQQLATQPSTNPSSSSNAAPAYVLAQQYVTPQFEYESRKCYVRLWAVITSVQPLRLYVYNGGVLIFGKQDANQDALGEQQQNGNTNTTSKSKDGIVNLWQMDRASSMTWSFAKLKQHMAEIAGQQQQQQNTGTGSQHEQLQQRKRGNRRVLGVTHSHSDLSQAQRDMTDDQKEQLTQTMQITEPLVKGARDEDGSRALLSNRQLLGRRRQGRRRRRRRQRKNTPSASNDDTRFQAMLKRMHHVIGLAIAAGLPNMQAAGSNVDKLMEDASWDSWGIQTDGSGGVGPGIETLESMLASAGAETVHDHSHNKPTEHQYVARPAGYEVLGVDFLLDANYQPHLLEINTLPSMAPLLSCGDKAQCQAASQAYADQQLELHQEQQLRQEVMLLRRRRKYRGGLPKQPGRALLGNIVLHTGDAEHTDDDSHGTEQKLRNLQQDQGDVPRQDMSATGQSFDMEKHHAVHSFLALLGVPVHPSGPDPEGKTLPNQDSKMKQIKLPQDYAPSSHPGSGAVLSLAAALLAQPMPEAGSQANPGNASIVLSQYGNRFPAALQAAELALPRIHKMMCPGLPPVPAAIATLSSSPKQACPEGCLMLQELQVLAELEYELSVRKGLQPVFALQAAVQLNNKAWRAASQQSSSSVRPPLSWLQRLKQCIASWLGYKQNKWLNPDGPAAVDMKPTLRLQPHPHDTLTQQAIKVRRGMMRRLQPTACLKSPIQAANCAVHFLNLVISERCPNNTDSQETVSV